MDSETETGLYNGKNDCMSTNKDGYISNYLDNTFRIGQLMYNINITLM